MGNSQAHVKIEGWEDVSSLQNHSADCLLTSLSKTSDPGVVQIWTNYLGDNCTPEWKQVLPPGSWCKQTKKRSARQCFTPQLFSHLTSLKWLCIVPGKSADSKVESVVLINMIWIKITTNLHKIESKFLFCGKTSSPGREVTMVLWRRYSSFSK